MDFAKVHHSTGSRMPLPDMEILDRTAREISAVNIVEIGSAGGGSSCVLGNVVRDTGGHLYCIDPRPEGRWLPNIKEEKLEEFVTMINLPSPWINISQIPQPVDYIFIDGNHKTRWMLMDYHFWFPFVKIGGRLSFHDINGQCQSCDSAWVNRALDIIMEDDSDLLKEVGRTTNKGGVLVLEKIGDRLANQGFGTTVNVAWKKRFLNASSL